MAVPLGWWAGTVPCPWKRITPRRLFGSAEEKNAPPESPLTPIASLVVPAWSKLAPMTVVNVPFAVLFSTVVVPPPGKLLVRLVPQRLAMSLILGALGSYE